MMLVAIGETASDNKEQQHRNVFGCVDLVHFLVATTFSLAVVWSRKTEGGQTVRKSTSK